MHINLDKVRDSAVLAKVSATWKFPETNIDDSLEESDDW